LRPESGSSWYPHPPAKPNTEALDPVEDAGRPKASYCFVAVMAWLAFVSMPNVPSRSARLNLVAPEVLVPPESVLPTRASSPL